MAAETRRVIWRHPRGIYETVEVSGTGVFGVPLAIVAASMHRSSKTVRAVLEKHGVTMRKYGPRTKKNH